MPEGRDGDDEFLVVSSPHGGVAADEFFRAHAAETRAVYGPPGEG